MSRIPWTDPGGTPCCCTVCTSESAIPANYYGDDTYVPTDYSLPNRRFRQITAEQLLLYEAGGTYEGKLSGSFSSSWSSGSLDNFGDPTVSSSGSISWTIAPLTVEAELPSPRNNGNLVNCGIGYTVLTDLSPDPFAAITPSITYAASYNSGANTGTSTTLTLCAIRFNWRNYPLGIRQTLDGGGGTEFVGAQTWRQCDPIVQFGGTGANFATTLFAPTNFEVIVDSGVFLKETINGSTVYDARYGYIAAPFQAFGVFLKYNGSGQIDCEMNFTSNAP